jgi:hypothetical protein
MVRTAADMGNGSYVASNQWVQLAGHGRRRWRLPRYRPFAPIGRQLKIRTGD